jgi:hypothetical protein
VTSAELKLTAADQLFTLMIDINERALGVIVAHA